MTRSLLKNLLHLSDRESTRPDLARAMRTTAAIMAPLLLAAFGLLGHGRMIPLEMSFVAIAAHATAGVDIHGPYPLRLGFMLVTILVMAGCTALGSAAGGEWWSAALAAAVVGINTGVWRHLTPEYGPSLAIPTGLVFLMSLAFPPAPGHGYTLSVLVGAGWALVLQMALWPIRPQHPLRSTIAGTWLAAGTLFDKMHFVPPDDGLVAAEADFRSTFDRHDATLLAIRKSRPLLPQLEALNLAAARLVTRVSALRTAMEPLVDREHPTDTLAAFDTITESLSQTAQSVALAVVSRQPSHLAMAEVRFCRAAALMQALKARLRQTPSSEATQAVAVIELVDGQLSDCLLHLVAVTERSGERAVFPLELFDISTWRLQPLAAALNLRPRPDPALVRFTLRLAVLLMLGVMTSKLLTIHTHLSHAYWLPFTILVVSQTDYGATRERAIERLVGTLIGSVIASGLLFLHLPRGAALAAIAVSGFCFSFLLKRNYRFAVALVTIMVVLLIEMGGSISIELTLERVGFTAFGGAIALAAALMFWPSWERRRFPPMLADALSANLHFLRQVIYRLSAGGPYGPDEVAAKRTAEQANAAAFASLARLYADPASKRSGVEQAAVIANGSQRLTRYLNLLLLNATPSAPPRNDSSLAAFAQQSEASMQQLIESLDVQTEEQPDAASGIGSPILSATDASSKSLRGLLTRAQTEIEAMQQALRPASLAAASDNAKHLPELAIAR